MKKVILLFAILLCIGLPAEAQNPRTKTFPLNKEFQAQVVLCGELEFAKHIADDDSTITFQVYSLVGVCGGGTVRVTYVKLAYKGLSNVYEVQINGQTAYAITDGTHESL